MVAKWDNVYSASDEFVGHNSKGKEIYGIRMVHLADNLRSHIARCPGSILFIFRRIFSRHSHICKSEVSFWVENEVFRFDISMNNIVLVKILKTEKDAADKKFDYRFRKLLNSTDLEPQISSWHVVYYEV